MSRDDRDKSKWRLRQLVKRREELFTHPCSSEDASLIRTSTQYREIQREIESVSMKYGGSLDAYAGRKCSTRKSVAERKKVLRRIKKRVGNRAWFNEVSRELLKAD